jgi:hypothetical protein
VQQQQSQPEAGGGATASHPNAVDDPSAVDPSAAADEPSAATNASPDRTARDCQRRQ